MDKNKTTIGKDVIESLTSGMYEDSKFIFREYIQNAVDQIDKAIESGVISTRQGGNVWINLDKSERKIIIEDDATGIKHNEALDILRNIAQSTKKRGVDRGFRGIGRLGGLGYCEQLTFETSFKGEKSKSIMLWDAKELKKIINDRTQKEEASQVIGRVTDFDIQPEDIDKHYFRVTLEQVSNDALFDKKAITDYLSMVAPAPFHRHFLYNDIISDKLEENGLKIDEYKIFLNADQIFKAYTTSIYDGEPNNKRKVDDIFDICNFRIEGHNNELLGWGWYGLSTFNGVLPDVNLARGLRLRKDNIQIGSADTLARLHKQKKNNFYFFGEVHAFHPDLIPNSRRDYFVDNDCLFQFENELKKIFDEKLKPLFNKASKIRSAQNTIINFHNKKTEIDNVCETGITSKEDKQRLEDEVEQKRKKAEEGKKLLEKMESELKNEDDPLKKIYSKIVNKKLEVTDSTSTKKKIKDMIFRTDQYSKLSKSERKLISKIFQIIDDVLNKELAENLKCKIDEKFK
ncbi:MAG TPA: ATP-binding protein [Candidatus Dojkabacteria bacterium]|nr:ATP-binding protein [Candidatus Dojkabacteria bacterium]